MSEGTYWCLRVSTVGYRRLQQVTEWLQCVTTVYSKVPSGYSVLQQVTAGYRVVTVGYSSSPSGYSELQQVTAGYRVVIVCDSRLQRVTEWL